MLEKLITPRKNYIQRIWQLILIVMLLPVLTNSGFAQPGSSDPSKSTAKEKISAETLIEDTEILVKVVSVKDNVVSANEYIKPDAGNKFVSVQVVIENKSLDEWEVKPDEFKLKDAEGSVYETETSFTGLSDITQPTLKSGAVDNDDFVKGWITFQVGSSVNVKSLKLRYEDSGILSGPTVKSGWISLSAVLK